MSDWVENIINENYLKDNLTFSSIYIAVYENMVDSVITKIKDFLCEEYIDKGEIFYNETEDYKNKIRKRVVDDKGNKDITKASFLWFVDSGAISQTDYEEFLKIKKVRNKFAHNLTDTILKGISEDEISLLFSMLNLFKKINGWWFREYEINFIEPEILENAELDYVVSAANVAFDIIINVLYNGKSKEYKKMMEKIQNDNND